MKQIFLTLMLAACAFAGSPCDKTQEFHTALVDAYVSLAQSVPLPIPGSGSPVCKVGASIFTSDTDAEALVVNIQVSLADGTLETYRQLVNASNVKGVPTYVEFSLPLGAVPTGIYRLDVTRLHQEPIDTLVCAPCSGH